jgi:hypothetical protein
MYRGCLTSVRHLTGIPSRRLGSKLRESRSDLPQSLKSGSVSGPLVTVQSDGLLLARLGILDLGGDGDDLVVKPARLLGDFRPSEGLDGVFVLHLAADVEVVADILGSLAHGLQTVGGFLVLQDLFVEGLGPAVAARAHGFGAHGHANIDRPESDLIGDVVDGFQSGGAETVD